MLLKTIYVFRHGQTDYNVERRVMGQLDIPLNNVGHAQATELAEKLATAAIGAVYSSPLARAMETARAVANKIGVPIITDAQKYYEKTFSAQSKAAPKFHNEQVKVPDITVHVDMKFVKMVQDSKKTSQY